MTENRNNQEENVRQLRHVGDANDFTSFKSRPKRRSWLMTSKFLPDRPPSTPKRRQYDADSSFKPQSCFEEESWATVVQRDSCPASSSQVLVDSLHADKHPSLVKHESPYFCQGSVCSKRIVQEASTQEGTTSIQSDRQGYIHGLPDMPVRRPSVVRPGQRSFKSNCSFLGRGRREIFTSQTLAGIQKDSRQTCPRNSFEKFFALSPAEEIQDPADYGDDDGKDENEASCKPVSVLARRRSSVIRIIAQKFANQQRETESNAPKIPRQRSSAMLIDVEKMTAEASKHVSEAYIDDSNLDARSAPPKMPRRRSSSTSILSKTSRSDDNVVISRNGLHDEYAETIIIPVDSNPRLPCRRSTLKESQLAILLDQGESFLQVRAQYDEFSPRQNVSGMDDIVPAKHSLSTVLEGDTEHTRFFDGASSSLSLADTTMSSDDKKSNVISSPNTRGMDSLRRFAQRLRRPIHSVRRASACKPQITGLKT